MCAWLQRVAKSAAVALPFFLVVAACDTTPEFRSVGGGAGGSSGQGGAGGTFSFDTPDAGPAVIAPPAGPACAEETVRKAEPTPIDLLLLVDRSGSMDAMLATGETKWMAMRTALNAFITSPKSVGLGVGLQYFPRTSLPGRAACMTDADCGTVGGRCLVQKHCMEADGKTGQNSCMNTDAACNGGIDRGARCLPIGHCMAGGAFCFVGGKACANGDTCVGQSLCVFAPGACSPEIYATAQVPIAELPGAASKLMTTVQQTGTGAGTPMHPASIGALQYLKNHAGANGGRKVVLVMATDGLPASCSETTDVGTATAAIADVLAAGRAQEPRISTYVIGIMSPKEMMDHGSAPLDRLAVGGGTNRPFLVVTTQNVAQKLVEALDAIRGSALPCEYPLPKSKNSDKIDVWQVNVSFTSAAGQVTTLGNVRDEASCRPDVGGWYYDRDPRSGGTPTSIVVCPVSCERFKQDPQGRVDLRLGCKTIIE